MPRVGRRISSHAERIEWHLDTAWLTAKELAILADVAPRTARLHLSRLVASGEAILRETWPALQYKRAAQKRKAVRRG
jgi:hypothetical protein